MVEVVAARAIATSQPGRPVLRQPRKQKGSLKAAERTFLATQAIIQREVGGKDGARNQKGMEGSPTGRKEVETVKPQLLPVKRAGTAVSDVELRGMRWHVRRGGVRATNRASYSSFSIRGRSRTDIYISQHAPAGIYEAANNSIRHRALCNTIMDLYEFVIKRDVRSGDVMVHGQPAVTIEIVRASGNLLMAGRWLVR